MLYGLEMWLMSLRIGRTMGGFSHRLYHRLIGKKPHRGQDGRWVYTPLEEAMVVAGLQEV